MLATASRRTFSVFPSNCCFTHSYECCLLQRNTNHGGANRHTKPRRGSARRSSLPRPGARRTSTGADQRHGIQPGNDRSEGHQGLPGHRALHRVSIDTSGTNIISIRGISSSGAPAHRHLYRRHTHQMRALGFNPDTLPRTFGLIGRNLPRLFGAGRGCTSAT